MSFDEYLIEMTEVIQQLDVDLKQYDTTQFDDLVEMALFKLSKSKTDWDEISRNKINLNFNGTIESFADVVINLSRSVLSVIYDKIPEIEGNLEKHILRMLLIHFTIRLLYHLRNKYEPSLGELQVSNLVATIRHKPVKLYNVLRDSYMTFIEVNYPDIIVVNESI